MLEIGRITRPHGVRGDVLVSLTTNRAERLETGAVLASRDRELVVRASRPHRRGWIVDFEGVSDRNAAEAVSGTILYAEPINDPDELWVHELIGAVVVDQHGISRGTVVGVVENPASDLLELESGALVPVRFVTDLLPAERITVDAPDGIFDLAGDVGDVGQTEGHHDEAGGSS
ncbi:MAG: ribosome maturation factor RimM [Acidimicrobiaceae bacterium]|nr:ribosome maturation factor RimM [Acidimicrobiaceae bacterium]MDE0607351.1 ribosome maturation factor RimM [Acidimicrobiaceae bacterium]